MQPKLPTAASVLQENLAFFWPSKFDSYINNGGGDHSLGLTLMMG
jgi:hypothetical protein